jgi:hypothetical protein
MNLNLGSEYLHAIAQITAPTLSVLALYFEIEEYEEADDRCVQFYNALHIFFSKCRQICFLRLEYIDFGDDPAAITQTIIAGIGRLAKLGSFDCDGDFERLFLSAPLENLRSLGYHSSSRNGAPYDLMMFS